MRVYDGMAIKRQRKTDENESGNVVITDTNKAPVKLKSSSLLFEDSLPSGVGGTMLELEGRRSAASEALRLRHDESASQHKFANRMTAEQK